MERRKKKAAWQKALNKALVKTIRDKRKTMKEKEKIHRKAVKARRKKTEKNVDRILVGSCFLVCLVAALLEAKEN